jgi:hypothetical protein
VLNSGVNYVSVTGDSNTLGSGANRDTVVGYRNVVQYGASDDRGTYASPHIVPLLTPAACVFS